MTQFARLSLGLLSVMALSACVSVKIPKVDFLKEPEFKDAVAKVDGYPDPADAPDAPNDIRSAATWDSDAQKLIDLRDNYQSPALDTSNYNETLTEQDIEALKAKVRAYKLDDPPPGTE